MPSSILLSYIFKGDYKAVCISIFFFFLNMIFLKPVCWNPCVQSIHNLSYMASGFSCPPCAAKPVVLLCFLPKPHCYYFLFLLEIFIRTFKLTVLLPFYPWYNPVVQYRRGQEEWAGIVRSVTTPIYVSFSLACSDASGAETKVTICGNPAELPLFHAPGALGWAGAGLPAPQAQGMLKNKHIPFRKWESEIWHHWFSS